MRNLKRPHATKVSQRVRDFFSFPHFNLKSGLIYFEFDHYRNQTIA